jgi:phage N-6-adenine-methyltransferase
MIVNTELSRSTGHISKDLWETPPHIFKKLNDEFHFALDPCCTVETAKCPDFFTPSENGLIQSWQGYGTIFVNPPYSRDNIDQWLKKCHQEAKECIIVALIPVSTSAKWFHDYVIGKASLRFYERRIRFVGAPYTAPFSSLLAIWDHRQVTVTSIKQ